MNSLCIRDYLRLKEINNYLEDRKQLLLNENGNFETLETRELTELIEGLQIIINRLEKEGE